MAHDLTIGSTVYRKSKTASNGRTGQIIEIQADHVRVHWTRKANGNPMSQRGWVFANELAEVVTSPAVASIHKKMNYIIEQVERGPLTPEEMDNLFSILEQIQGTSLWAIGIRAYMDSLREDDDRFIAGLADQCMDDIFTMTCIVGQKAVIYLLRTVKPR